VTDSYRETTVRTVEYFTGQTIDRDRIQDYKNQGGWNNDWALSQRLAADLGVEISYDTVVDKFQEFFLGPDGDGCGGLIERERWLPANGLLDRLSASYQLAIFTGRIRSDLDITLRRFAPGVDFDPTVCTREIANGKPAPDGLEKIRGLCPDAPLWFVGDTVDDSACAKAAGVPFVGVAAPGPRRHELAALFEADGATAVVENVNQLQSVLP
jgi:HAD superfamily phosphatase